MLKRTFMFVKCALSEQKSYKQSDSKLTDFTGCRRERRDDIVVCGNNNAIGRLARLAPIENYLSRAANKLKSPEINND